MWTTHVCMLIQMATIFYTSATPIKVLSQYASYSPTYAHLYTVSQEKHTIHIVIWSYQDIVSNTLKQFCVEFPFSYIVKQAYLQSEMLFL